MMSSFGLWLKRLTGRWLVYALGLCVVLVILGAGVFVTARPSLLSFVTAEIGKYGIEASSPDISILGNIQLENVKIAMKDGGVLTAGRFSGRPPLPWLGGDATLYDVVLKKGDITLAIPELRLKNVSQSARNPAISSREMQLLMRFNAARVEAPEIDVTVVRNANINSEKMTIRHFTLEGLREGKIGRVMIGGVDSVLASAPLSRSNIHSGLFSAENIDLAAAYAFAKGVFTPEDKAARVIAGPVRLDDLKIDFAEEKGRSLHIAIGALNSAGLSLRPAATPLAQAVEALFASGRDMAAAEKAEKKKGKALQRLRDVLENIAAIDARISDVAVESANVSMHFSYLELKSRNWRQLIPYGFMVSLQGLTVDTKQADNEYARFLHDMGYEKIELSLLGDMLWNPADRTLALRNIVFSGKDIGEVSFQGTLLNLDEGFFTGDMPLMQAALEGSAISEIDMALADGGIINRFLDWETTQINVSKQELKDSLYEIAVKSPPLLLKNHKDTQLISNAFGAFVRDSGTLRIRMAAREKSGISLSALTVAQADLSVLLDQVHLSVTTGKPPPGAAMIN